jgi:hypothetical protein
MCSDDPSVICPVNGVLTSVSFALTGNYSYRGDYNGNLIIAAGQIINNDYMETYSINIPSVSIHSMSIYTNSELNLKIKTNDVVFIGSMHKDTVYTILKRSGDNINYNDSCYIVNYDTKTYLGNQTQSWSPYSPQYILTAEDLSNVKEEIDRINNEITEIHNTDTLILNS